MFGVMQFVSIQDVKQITKDLGLAGQEGQPTPVGGLSRTAQLLAGYSRSGNFPFIAYFLPFTASQCGIRKTIWSRTTLTNAPKL